MGGIPQFSVKQLLAVTLGVSIAMAVWTRINRDYEMLMAAGAGAAVIVLAIILMSLFASLAFLLELLRPARRSASKKHGPPAGDLNDDR